MNIDFSKVKDSPIINGPPRWKINSAYDMFNQNHYWHGETGWYAISQMQDHHRLNVCRFLEARAGEIQMMYIFSMPDPGNFLQGDHALDEAYRLTEIEGEETMAMKPREWLHQTPLFKRMSLGLPI